MCNRWSKYASFDAKNFHYETQHLKLLVKYLSAYYNDVRVTKQSNFTPLWYSFTLNHAEFFLVCGDPAVNRRCTPEWVCAACTAGRITQYRPLSACLGTALAWVDGRNWGMFCVESQLSGITQSRTNQTQLVARSVTIALSVRRAPQFGRSLDMGEGCSQGEEQEETQKNNH